MSERNAAVVRERLHCESEVYEKTSHEFLNSSFTLEKQRHEVQESDYINQVTMLVQDQKTKSTTTVIGK